MIARPEFKPTFKNDYFSQMINLKPLHTEEQGLGDQQEPI